VLRALLRTAIAIAWTIAIATAAPVLIRVLLHLRARVGELAFGTMLRLRLWLPGRALIRVALTCGTRPVRLWSALFLARPEIAAFLPLAPAVTLLAAAVALVAIALTLPSGCAVTRARDL